MRLANAVALRLLLMVVISGAIVMSVGMWNGWEPGYRTVVLVLATGVCMLVVLAEILAAVVEWRAGGDGFRGDGT